MDFEDIRLAIESRLAAWNGVPVAYDGVPNSPTLQAAIDAKQPWVRLTIVDGDSFTACLGASPEVRRTGLIMCQVFTNDNIGSAEARRIADSLASQLQYWREGALETHASSLQRIGPRDGWFQYNTRTPFRAG